MSSAAKMLSIDSANIPWVNLAVTINKRLIQSKINGPDFLCIG